MRSLIAAGWVAAALLGAGNADAKLWSFSYSGGGESGQGEFITSDDGSPYTVTGVTGVADGSAITGLSSYGGADQLLNVPGTPSYFTYWGVSFLTEAGISYNLTSFGDGDNNIASSLVNPAGDQCCGVTPIEMTLAAVPEMSTWAMLLVGFAGLGWAGLHRRRARVRVRG